jgi:hypothetical protein
MAEVTVYGASDDLIEVEGAITEEFYAHSRGPSYLVFNEGTVLRVEYTKDGMWEIRRERSGTAEYAHAPHDNEVTTYTDRVTLVGDLSAVGLAERPPRQDATGATEGAL